VQVGARAANGCFEAHSISKSAALPEVRTVRYTGQKSSGWVSSTGRVWYPVIQKILSSTSVFFGNSEKIANPGKIGVKNCVTSFRTLDNIQTVGKHDLCIT
jgi:hypothetical protein